MSFKNRPKLRISLYKYDFTFVSFLTAFRATALQQGWTPEEVTTLIDSTHTMDIVEATNYLMQYACIVKLPKGYRIKNGKPINKT